MKQQDQCSSVWRHNESDMIWNMTVRQEHDVRSCLNPDGDAMRGACSDLGLGWSEDRSSSLFVSWCCRSFCLIVEGAEASIIPEVKLLCVQTWGQIPPGWCSGSTETCGCSYCCTVCWQQILRTKRCTRVLYKHLYISNMDYGSEWTRFCHLFHWLLFSACVHVINV